MCSSIFFLILLSSCDPSVLFGDLLEGPRAPGWRSCTACPNVSPPKQHQQQQRNDSAVATVPSYMTKCYYLCNVGRSSVSCSGSLVLGITPMMVLFSEVPLSSRWLTRCMFRGESTLNLTVEPGRSTPSCDSSSGRRLGILIPPSEVIVRCFKSQGTLSNTTLANKYALYPLSNC